MTGPLNGIRIIDLTAMVSGPLATMMLADQGAEVIKVENPSGGDFTRSAANRQGNVSASFLNNNRNKKSVALNLKEPAGREALLKLVATADVFVQNFRPGVIDRMGLGEDELRKVAPNLIMVSISGFGDTGPFAQRPVYDPLIQALSGLATVQAGTDERRPQLVRTILPDKLTGVVAAQAITAALFARERTGEGQHVRLSMLDAIIAFLWSSDMGSQTFVQGELPQQAAASFQDLIYETTTGYITIAVQNDREWQALIRAVNRPEWAEDPSFLTAELRQKNIDARLDLIQSVIRTDSAEHWLARLEEESVPCAPVLTRTQVLDHPQVQANDLLVEYDHPQAGHIRQTRAPARFSATPMQPWQGAPALGQDTVASLAGCGYSSDDIQTMVDSGVAGLPE
ncbi:CoA transferase [Marinobacter sp. M3C]|jgi:crotonobetainyl-CoA:carnitine CoA-transferase CaiB-like acyl-CoA transferase|uniref:CaiB/BaiF CoA transferase family protein n=1 Tax=unclassified Marinobacter TaxID=83889 RepID=UPI00200C7B76|nr:MULTISPECIES: CoA transferase [unclassified Marinobacter]MCL1476235.1 CoA transferase [Marinobacter sp.]MCL1480060.1 CoA transferase [Marinobacter sp.]MCL1482992.1 CoA transferase [Marinobacter sp.]MCL1488805.1 CoA transferase [Marinobacter sp.]UQG58112.1 CoA transferase [Marinobacter sp. M4C]